MIARTNRGRTDEEVSAHRRRTAAPVVVVAAPHPRNPTGSRASPLSSAFDANGAEESEEGEAGVSDKATDSESEVLDVLVVGGGFSGLSAARELEALGVKYRLLDSFSDHLGGRAYSFDASVTEGTKLRFDHGAEYVGDAQNTIMTQVKELLPAGSLVNGANMRLPYSWEVMVLNQERYAFESTESLFGIPGCPPQIGVLGAIGMIGMIAEMSLIEALIDVVEPWKGPPSLLALDQTDVWTWLGEKKWLTAAVKDLMRISIEALLSVEPSQISPYYLLWYTACNDGFLNEINDDAGGPQQYWLTTGTSSLAERYADPVRPRITQGTRATTIDLRGDVVLVTTDKGETLRAKKVLVATSSSTAGKIAYLPEPCAARKALMAQPMGKTLKCQVFYKTAWWHDSNGLAYDGYVGGANYPILWVMDNSAADGKGPNVLMTFTVGSQVDALGPNPSKEAIVTLVTGTLRDLFLDDRALAGSSEFIALTHYMWSPEEPFVGGGPNTVFTPGMLTGDAGKIMDQPWDDKVFFACAENAKNLTPSSTSTRYNLFANENLPQYDAQCVLLPTSVPPFSSKYSDMRPDLGYMSGAMESGRYVAHQIAASLGLPNRLPKAAAPRAEPVAPTEDIVGAKATLTPDHVAEVLAALKAELTGPGALVRLEAFARAGLGGRGSFAALLRELLATTLTAGGNAVSATDPGHSMSLVGHLRDFAVTCAEHANGPFASQSDGAHAIETAERVELHANGANDANDANDASANIRAHLADLERVVSSKTP